MGPVVDAETGFQYLRARYYDPSTGQFLNRDPIEALTRDAYGYAGNNPLNNIDPDGMNWLSDRASDVGNAVAGGAQAVGRAASDVGRGALDIVAVPLYAEYYGSYYAVKGINAVGDHFGPLGTVASRVASAPFVPFEAWGLGADVGIDWLKGEDWADESKCQSDKRPINPLHSFLPKSLEGPSIYLPGFYRDPSGDPHAKFEW